MYQISQHIIISFAMLPHIRPKRLCRPPPSCFPTQSAAVPCFESRPAETMLMLGRSLGISPQTIWHSRIFTLTQRDSLHAKWNNCLRKRDLCRFHRGKLSASMSCRCFRTIIFSAVVLQNRSLSEITFDFPERLSLIFLLSLF